MHKKIFIIFIPLFLLVTCIAFIADTKVKKISFSNQNFELHNKETEVANKDVDISLNGTKFENKNITSSSVTTAEVNNLQQTTQINTSVSNSETLNIKTNDTINQNLPPQNRKSRYAYENISWNEWKSNFVNKILDDLDGITFLDKYGIGTWFYYSFDVMNDGYIRNISVFSFYLDKDSKNSIIKLIKSYQYTDITKFPKNSKRKKAKIDAIVVLSDSESKSAPSDFNDNERVKFEY